jgi:protein-disulfide isomerase
LRVIGPELEQQAMHRRARTWMRAGVGLGLAVLFAAPAQAGTDDPAAGLSTEQIERIVHDYLLREPDVVYQALQELQRRQDAAKAEHQKTALVANHAQLFQHADDPIGGNPEGDVTVVEFFDYQCAYCRRVMPSLQAQLREDNKLKVVFKDFPILGDNSVTAARAALAARKQDRYVPFHFALMAASDLSLDGIMAAAASVGIDTRRLAADMNAPEIESQIQANYTLAKTLGIEGTPAFVIGDELIPGALSKTRLTELIQQARSGCVNC